MAQDGNALVVTRNSRTVTLQSVSTNDRYLALVGCGVSKGRAAAVASGLVTMKVRA